MKLSVVVIVYNIRREAPRTLLSLSAAYQRNVDANDYEVIVVENGGKNRLDPAAVTAFGPNFSYRYIEDAKPSPAAAINFGIAQARGEIVGVMIDGARICSPGMLEQVLAASRLHPRAITATLGFYLGDGYQRDTIRRGYNQAVEDELLDSIDWPKDGYRLFEIGVADECSHFFGPLYESNALFMPKVMWNELHGVDERFDIPGGGLLNLDTLYRACGLPDSELIILLGEATFHQVHGGVATNTLAEAFEPLILKWKQQYRELTGMEYIPSLKLRQYLGTLPLVCLKPMCAEINEILIPPSFAAERATWKSKLAKSEEQLAVKTSEAEAAQSESDRLRVELDLLQQSHSWLFTKPLRTAFRGVTAIRSRLSKPKNGSSE